MKWISKLILTWSLILWNWIRTWWLETNKQLYLNFLNENETEIFEHKWKTYEKIWKSTKEEISWYWWKFHWRKTASWEIFDENKLTAAHKTLPFWTKVMMIDEEKNDTVIVKVNDRWPFVKWRSYDVSKQAAKELWNLLLEWHKKVDCTIVREK